MEDSRVLICAEKRKNMKYLHITLFMMLLIITGCYGSMSGTVVDAETGKPIEGAVVLVEWTKTKGVPGLTYGETYQTIEVVTDHKGCFSTPGILTPFVNPPIMAIYKQGYIIWSNHYVFPSWEKRNEFNKQTVFLIKLDHFRQEFSHEKHVAFISSAAVSGSGGKIFSDAYLEEWKQAQQEINNPNKDIK